MGRLGHPLQKNVQKMQRQPFGFQPLSEGEGKDAGSRFSATGEMIMKDGVRYVIGKGVKFERIRRITGYLVGTLDRFNDAKRAEEHDRVKHVTAAHK